MLLLFVVGSSNKRKLVADDDEQPKRPCSAFCYYMQAKKNSFVGTNAAVCDNSGMWMPASV